MTVLFHDIHKDPEVEEELNKTKIPNANFHEILLVDDTIFLS